MQVHSDSVQVSEQGIKTITQARNECLYSQITATNLLLARWLIVCIHILLFISVCASKGLTEYNRSYHCARRIDGEHLNSMCNAHINCILIKLKWRCGKKRIRIQVASWVRRRRSCQFFFYCSTQLANNKLLPQFSVTKCFVSTSIKSELKESHNENALN